MSHRLLSSQTKELHLLAAMLTLSPADRRGRVGESLLEMRLSFRLLEVIAAVPDRL